MKPSAITCVALCIALLACSVLTSCVFERSKDLIAPKTRSQEYSPNIRCTVDNQPWLADYAGTASSIMQSQYLADSNFLTFSGFASYGTDAALGIEFFLKDINLSKAVLHKPSKVIFAGPLATNSTVAIQIAGPDGFKYLTTPDGNGKSFITWEVVERGNVYLIVKGSFQAYFSQSGSRKHSIRHGEFEIRVNVDRP